MSKSSIQRHLSAFETYIGFSTRPGLLAFISFSSGSTAAGTLTASYDALLFICALRGAQQEVGHYSISSTVTKWATVRTIPKIAGLFSCSTQESILRNPRERTVAR
jgi:hypothetical protein